MARLTRNKKDTQIAKNFNNFTYFKIIIYFNLILSVVNLLLLLRC